MFMRASRTTGVLDNEAKMRGSWLICLLWHHEGHFKVLDLNYKTYLYIDSIIIDILTRDAKFIDSPTDFLKHLHIFNFLYNTKFIARAIDKLYEEMSALRRNKTLSSR